MSLNCLTCGNALQRVKSDKEYAPENKGSMKMKMNIERMWSGNISETTTQHVVLGGGSVSKIKKEHHHRMRRSNSTGNNVGPRLVRSSGMRRDWSLEDLLNGHQNKRTKIIK
ncbi:hypothetical protein Lal_00040010 [Lupinus albus]|uniref:Uncharacterized protein n=1 Tax=Lupinus albus TaxID=3870 RepID=A0A6A4Q213_LUPAL|nr:hypothetical protein Lalb_Chr09g0334701 [Lupinus albus]KAF1862745.1 hypothetical protein Lal_00040010 [Lupinus albus]